MYTKLHILQEMGINTGYKSRGRILRLGFSEFLMEPKLKAILFL